MRLYHFTTREHHWPRILKSGLLTVTESNLSLTQPHGGPDVVWLTKDPAPKVQSWGLPKDYVITAEQVASGVFGTALLPDPLEEELRTTGQVMIRGVDKTALRITVDIPDADALWWWLWARDNGMPKAHYEAFTRTDPGYKSWYVVLRPIPAAEWVLAEDLTTSEILWPVDRIGPVRTRV